MVFMAALLNLAEFLITGNGLFVLVRIRLARRIRAGIVDIEHEFADTIAGLRLVPRSGPVSCELWLYSKHGILRHFRVEDTRLVEIDCCGIPLDQVRAAAAPTGSVQPDGGLVGPAAEHAGKVPAGPAPNPECLSIRWLKKWNAARKAAEKSGQPVSDALQKMLDAGKPGGPKQKSSGKKSGRKNDRKPETDPGKIIPEPGAAEAAGQTVSPRGATAVAGESLPEESNQLQDTGDRGGGPMGDDPNGV
jgi:hypothetical protein